MKEECLAHPTIQKTVRFPYTFLIFVFSHLLWVYTYILFIFTLQSQSCSSSSAFYPFPLVDKPTNKDFALRKTFYCDSSESASGKKILKQNLLQNHITPKSPLSNAHIQHRHQLQCLLNINLGLTCGRYLTFFNLLMKQLWINIMKKKPSFLGFPSLVAPFQCPNSTRVSRNRDMVWAIPKKGTSNKKKRW